MLTQESASMLILAVMTKMLAQLTLAISTLVSAFTPLLLALMETNAQKNLVTLLKDANTLQSLATTIIFALSILAILAQDASSPTSQSMTKTLALKTTATNPLESYITMQSVAMTATHAQLTAATFQKDANILLWTLQQRIQQAATNAKFGSALLTRDSTKKLLIATIMICAQLILAIPPAELVSTLLSFALMRTNAQ
jgi:hypothetical protein